MNNDVHSINMLLMAKEIIRYEIQEVLDNENDLPTHIFFWLKYHFDSAYPVVAMESILNSEGKESEYYKTFSSYKQVIDIFKRQLITTSMNLQAEQNN
jgi:hypothetical protein